MCGRTSLFAAREDVEETFDARIVADGGYEPRYNIAPGEPLEVITNHARGEIDRFHWGLLPTWADDTDEGLINARAQTAGEKRSFADAWESRPCLVLSSGFCEWRETGGGPKRPYRVYREDAPAFAIAGLWEVWEGEGQTIPSVTILTTEPNELMEPIHDRMPVVLPRNEEAAWLAGGPEERAELCRPYPDSDLDAYEISTRVNDPGNDDPRVIEPLGHEQSGLDQF
ncbi:SOS response-associated peptidase [Salinirubellus sp. GCM10025818]|uniref:SOS response-associated peptidase n=1 Tax=Salinirubellus TaxID=2162630 RepID=UPI0030CF87E2